MENHLPKSFPEYIDILKKRKKNFFVPFLIVGALALVIYPFLPRFYTSAVTIMVNDDSTLNPVRSAGNPQMTNGVEKKIGLLSYQMASRPVREQIAERMGLPGVGKDVLKKRMMSLKSAVKVDRVGTSIIKISFSDRDPVLAQRGANAVADTILAIDRQDKMEEAKSTIDFVEEQLRVYKSKLQDSERPFYATQVKTQLDAALQRRSLLLDQIGNMEQSIDPSKRSENPAMYKVQSELAESRSMLKKLEMTAREGSPMVKELRNKVADLEATLSAEKENASATKLAGGSPEYNTALRELKQLNMEINTLRSQQDQITSTAPDKKPADVRPDELLALERQRKVNEDIYQSLLRGLESAQLAQHAYDAAGSFKILDAAEKPGAPSWPDPLQTAAVGVMLAFMAGAAGVVKAEYSDTSFRSVADAKEHIKKMPLLATIPDFKAPKRKRHSVVNPSEVSPEIVTFHNPESLPAEYYRLLRTHLEFLNQKVALQTLLVTSSLPGEGKTTTSVNLAMSMANELNKRILLIDCDLRQGDVARQLNVSKKRGLSDYVAGLCDMNAIIKPSSLDNLKVIPAGESTQMPAKILSSERFKNLIEELRSHFDFIVLDSPPVLPLADVPILTNYADGVVLIIEKGKTPRKFVSQAMTTLEQSRRARILGYVLSKVESAVPEYAHRYFVGGLTLTR